MKTRFYFWILIYIIPNFSVYGQWKSIELATKVSFRSLSVVTNNIVWAGGSKGTIIRTTDGGENWDVFTITTVENLDFRGIHALSATTALAMSAGEAEKGLARIYKTIDAGKSWQLAFQTTQAGVFLDCLKMRDKKTGYVVGDAIGGKPYILYTKDGGDSWKQVPTDKLPATLDGEASYAASNSNIAIQGKSIWISTQSRIFYSKNDGKKWQVLQTPFEKTQSGGIFGLYFWNATEGIATGGDYKDDKKPYLNIARTHNGGKTWQATNFAEPVGLKESAWMRADGSLLVVGTSGTSLSKDSGTTWQAIDEQSFHVVQCKENTCFAIGGKGNVAKWEE